MEILVSDKKIQSAYDLVALFRNEGAEVVDYGGFINEYNFFITNHSHATGETSVEEHNKHKTDIKSLNLSEDKATAFYLVTTMASTLFHGKKNEKSDICTAASLHPHFCKKNQESS